MEQRPVRTGRPRSERARDAVLEAADDLLVEVGYAAMTMKGIAERAGVGRQTVYRWWASKAEILLEASANDAADELTRPVSEDAESDITAYLESLLDFLAHSPAGISYRALLAAAQHDTTVADLIATHDPLRASAHDLLVRLDEPRLSTADVEQVTARLLGPALFWILTGHDPKDFDARALAAHVVRDHRQADDRPPGRATSDHGPASTASSPDNAT